MASLFKDNLYASRSTSGIASNSLAAANGSFLQTGAAGITLAGTSGKIAGICNETKTFASDNFTVAKEKVSYTVARQGTQFKIAIDGGTVTVADEGVSYYNLKDSKTIDGTTEGAVASTVDTSDTGAAADAVVTKQFKLVKFISATVGIFEVV